VLLRRDPPGQLGVNGRYRQADRRRGRPASFRHFESEPPPVVRVDLPVKVTAQYEYIDELAGRLLADAEFADQVTGRAAVIGHAPEDIRPVPRHVIEASLGAARPDRVPVTAARGTQHRGHGDVLVLVMVVMVVMAVGLVCWHGKSLPGSPKIVKYLDSQGSVFAARATSAAVVTRTGRMNGMKNWVEWHDAYDDPSSALSARLERVRAHLARALDDAPAGEIRLVSLCAGQGRDVIGVLPWHPRRDDVRALLVEIDPRNAENAGKGADAADLPAVQVRQADAGLVASYADYLPAHVLLLCGIFGNVSDSDIERTAAAAPALCVPGATVIWTRHRREPDLTPKIRAWFAEAGFAELAFDEVGGSSLTSVGAGRLSRVAEAGPPDQLLFSFLTA
jgi:hypothetical protein